jgi:hypothetical protein
MRISKGVFLQYINNNDIMKKPTATETGIAILIGRITSNQLQRPMLNDPELLTRPTVFESSFHIELLSWYAIRTVVIM